MEIPGNCVALRRRPLLHLLHKLPHFQPHFEGTGSDFATVGIVQGPLDGGVPTASDEVPPGVLEVDNDIITIGAASADVRTGARLYIRVTPAPPPLMIVRYDRMDRAYPISRPRNFTLAGLREKLCECCRLAAEGEDLYYFPGGVVGRWADRRVRVDTDAAFAAWTALEDRRGGTALPRLWIYPRFEDGCCSQTHPASGSVATTASAASCTSGDDLPGPSSGCEGADESFSSDSESCASSDDDGASSSMRLVSSRLELQVERARGCC